MNINGWEYDFSTMKHWDVRDKMPYVTDKIFESPNKDVACLLYSIAEVRMLDFRGFFALFENKDEPKLLLCVDYINFYEFAYFSDSGRFLFLKATYRTDKHFVLILDLSEKKYAVVNSVPFGNCCSFKESETEFGVFEMCVDKSCFGSNVNTAYIKNEMIDIKELQFKDWSDLENGEDLNLQERSFFNIFKSREKIWRESIEKVLAQKMNAQEFVDRNKDKVLYFIPPYGINPKGRLEPIPIYNTAISGKFIAVFTTQKKAQEYAYMRYEADSKVPIYKKKFKDIMKILDRDLLIRDWGVAVDPFSEEWVAIPSGVRPTPKSLRY